VGSGCVDLGFCGTDLCLQIALLGFEESEFVDVFGGGRSVPVPRRRMLLLSYAARLWVGHFAW